MFQQLYPHGFPKLILSSLCHRTGDFLPVYICICKPVTYENNKEKVNKEIYIQLLLNWRKTNDLLGSVSLGNQFEQSFIVPSARSFMLFACTFNSHEWGGFYTCESKLPGSLRSLPFQHPHSQLSQMLPNNIECSKYISPCNSREFWKFILTA